MDIAELRKIMQPESALKADVWFSPPFRYFSVYISRALADAGITPNQVTLLSALSGVMAGSFFAFGSGLASIIGSLCLFLAFTFDCIDGEIARYKNMCSLTGLTFDLFAQFVIFISAITGISIGAYRDSGIFFSVIGLLAAILYLSWLLICLLPGTIALKKRMDQGGSVAPGNVVGDVFNESAGTQGYLSRFRSIIGEYLRTPNQELIFFLCSILDTARVPSPVILGIRISYIMTAVLILFFAFLGAVIFRIKLIASAKEADRLLEKLG